jgi:hypothetical protein
VLQLLVTANVAPNSVILSTLMTEAIRSSETPVPTRLKHSVTSQDTAFFIITAVKTSILTWH